jgi:hypothetical protein
MLYREIIAVCSEIRTIHINTLCGQNVELLNVKLVVHMVTTGLLRVKSRKIRQEEHVAGTGYRWCRTVLVNIKGSMSVIIVLMVKAELRTGRKRYLSFVGISCCLWRVYCYCRCAVERGRGETCKH